MNGEKKNPIEVEGESGADETIRTWKIDAFARQIRLTRQQIVDDDGLSTFDEAANSVGQSGLRAIVDLIYSTYRGAGATRNG
jgi:hypothetical protein